MNGFKIYDNKNEQWCKGNFVISKSGDLYKIRKFLIFTKLFVCSENRYTVYRKINSLDSQKCNIYEGDICEYKDSRGLIAYADEVKSYIFLNMKDEKYYLLTDKVCNKFKVIGNIKDNSDLIK